MLQNAYKDIINVKLVPDPVMDNIKENLGAKKPNDNVADETKTPQNDLTSTAESDQSTIAKGDQKAQAPDEPVEPDSVHRNLSLEGPESEAKVISPAAEKKA